MGIMGIFFLLKKKEKKILKIGKFHSKMEILLYNCKLSIQWIIIIL